MKVLHVLTTNQRRGAETSALALVDRLRGRGHACSVVALAPSPTSGNHAVDVLPGDGRLHVRALWDLRRRARRHDVVLAHGSTTLTACSVALLGSGIPFVYANIGDPLYWAPGAVRRARVRLLLGRAAKVAALSPTSEEILRRHFGVPSEDLAVITNGRDAEHFGPATPERRAQARRALDAAEGRALIAIIGALSPEKRVDVAVSAIAQFPDAELVVAGDGTLREDLETMAADVAPGRVRFLGQLDDVRPVLAASDVLLLTSDSEGLPGVLVEAGLSGLPVVSTDVGFVRDIVVAGVTGLLVPAGDSRAAAAALQTAFEHRLLWGPAARAHCVEAFALDRVAERWERLLLDAAEG